MSSRPEPSSAGPRRGARGEPDVELEELQRWFYGNLIRPALTSSAPLTAPLAEAAAARPAEEVVLPSATLSARQRLGIYAEMYLLRMVESLADDYPTVRALLGEDDFRDLCRDYLTHQPSQSFTLEHAGHGLPDHVAKTDRLVPAALLRDVARLERAVNQSFHAAPSEVLAPAVIGQIPVEQWPALGFRMTSGVHLLALAYPANAIVQSNTREEPLPPLEPEPTWTAVWRKDYVVWRQSLSRAQYAVLDALQRGRTMAEAVEAAQGAWDGEATELEEQLFQWFADWLHEGFFSALVLPTDRPRA